MIDILWIAFWTLVIYSAISTFIYILSRDNENVIDLFGLGIVGCVACIVAKMLRSIVKKFKYHIGKRSIFEEISTGNKYICKVSDAEDVAYLRGYKRIKRYTDKSEWNGLPYFSKDILDKAKINCDRCVYDSECCSEWNTPKCKHDEYGKILEFDSFIKK